MPAAARYIAAGQPSPPAPTIKALVLDNFFWPGRKEYNKIKPVLWSE